MSTSSVQTGAFIHYLTKSLTHSLTHLLTSIYYLLDEPSAAATTESSSSSSSSSMILACEIPSNASIGQSFHVKSPDGRYFEVQVIKSLTHYLFTYSHLLTLKTYSFRFLRMCLLAIQFT